MTNLPLDAVAAWYAEGPSDKEDQRFLDIFISMYVGACMDCGWERVPAEFEFWEVIKGEAINIIFAGEDPLPGPHSSCTLLCNKHTAERRAWKVDPDIRTVLIRRRVIA